MNLKDDSRTGCLATPAIPKESSFGNVVGQGADQNKG